MNITPRVLVVMLLVAACLVSCKNNSNGGGGGFAANTVSPVFRGARAVATVGGASVRLDWRPAYDNITAVSAIRYEIYVAATSGAQNFAAPIRTTTGGATSAILTASDSPLIAEGSTAYYVVRALDSDGNIDLNEVEVCARPMSASAVAFVGVVSPEGPGGSLGDISDPYPTIQSAINAVEGNGGGIVVVLDDHVGARTEDFNVTSASASAIGIFGGFPPAASFSPSPAGTDILAARDLEQFPSRLQRAPGALDNDLARVDNQFVPTFIDGFTFELLGSSERAVLGTGVDLQVSGCDLIDGGEVAFGGAPGNAAEGLAGSTTALVVGVDGNLEAGGSFGNLVEVESTTDVLRVQNCTVENASDLLRFTNGFVPVSGLDLFFTHNIAFDVDNALDCSLDASDSEFGGPVNIVIEDNEVRDCSSSALYVDDLADIGDGGVATLSARRNVVVGVSYDSLELYTGTVEQGIAVDVVIEDNTFLNSDEEHIYMDVGVAANQTTSVTCRDNVLGTSESEVIYLTYSSSGTTGAQDGGRFDFTFEGNVHTGGGEDIYLELPVAHGGRTDLTFVENTILDDYDEGLYLDIDGYAGSTSGKFAIDGVYFLNVFNNFISGYEPVIIEDARGTGDDSAVYGYFGNNIMAFADDGSSTAGLDAELDVRNGAWLFNRNFMGSGGQDSSEVALNIDTAMTAVPNEIRVMNNAMTLASGGGIEVDSAGPQPQLVNNTVAFNGLDGQYGIDESGSDSQVFVHNSIVSHSGGEDVEAAGSIRPTYSLIRDWVPATGFGNIGGEPIYDTSIIDLAGSSHNPTAVIPAIFSLAPASPAINAGDPDFRFNDPDGSRNDMGAYGGPGAGSLGVLPAGTEVPFVRVGARPFAGLHAGDTFVDPTSAITFVFTDEVDAVSAVGAVTVTSGGLAVPGTFSTTMHRDLVFTPSTVLNPTGAGRVTFSMSTSLRSADGQSLAWAERLDIPLDVGAATEVEPNDVNDGVIDINDIMAAQATGAGPGPDDFRFSGDLGSGGGTDGPIGSDIDVFAFSANAGDRIMATIAEQMSGSGVVLALYDGNGAKVVDGKFDAFDRGQGGTPYLDHTVESAATYYLVLSGGPVFYTLEVVLD